MKRVAEVIIESDIDAQTQQMIIADKLREIEEEEAANQKRDARTLEVMPDDTDNLEDEAEIQSWKQREFDRIMRFRLKEEELLAVVIDVIYPCIGRGRESTS